MTEKTMTPEQIAAEVDAWKAGDRVRIVRMGDLIEGKVNDIGEKWLGTEGGIQVRTSTGRLPIGITYAERIVPDRTVTWTPGDDWAAFVAQVEDGCTADVYCNAGTMRVTGPVSNLAGYLRVGDESGHLVTVTPSSRTTSITLHLPPEPDTSAWDKALVIADAEGFTYRSRQISEWEPMGDYPCHGTKWLATRGPIRVLVDADGKAVQ